VVLQKTATISDIIERRKNMELKAVIFDLDGVIVSTDECHYYAW
jgi:hypothetical protein